MAINRGNNPQELWPGLNALVSTNLARYPKEYQEIWGSGVKSNKAYEKAVNVALFQSATGPKGEGMNVTINDEAGETWTWTVQNQTYTFSFAITEEAMEDNLYGDLATRYVNAATRSMANLKELNAVYPFDQGFNSAVAYGDAKEWFSTAHPLKNGATNSNRSAVNADFNEGPLEAALIQMDGWKDDQGIPTQVRAQKAVLPIKYSFIAKRLFNTTNGRPGTADNDLNVHANNDTLPKGYVINHFLNDVDAWYLLTDYEDGMKHFVRIALQKSNEKDFNTGNWRYKLRERYCFSPFHPLSAFGNSGST